MSTNSSLDGKEKHAVAISISPILQRSVITITLPANEKENAMELPTPIFTPLDLDISILMNTKKQPLPKPLIPRIIVTPPETGKVSLSICFPTAPKSTGKMVSLPTVKRKKAPLPRLASISRPISEKEKVTIAEHVSKPTVSMTKVVTLTPTSSPSSSQPSDGNTTITMFPTTTPSTRLPILHQIQSQIQNQDQEIMHTIPLDPPTLPHTASTTTTKPEPRWSFYFSPVTTPRPFSLFSTLNYTFQPQPPPISQDLIPTTTTLSSKSTYPPVATKARIITWSSTANTSRRSIDLANERFPPNISNPLDGGRKERGCWENAKACVGRSVLEFRRRVWEGCGSGVEMDVTAYCRY